MLRQVRAVIMTSANLGPRTVIAVVRASLADIDIWQKNGVSRDVYKRQILPRLIEWRGQFGDRKFLYVKRII